MRIGHGYDVHRFAEGRKLILGGVEIPYAVGLLGHSDADVLTHAVMDALLGSRRAGRHRRAFPGQRPSLSRCRQHRIFLRRVRGLLAENGFRVGNIDATVVAQAPKLQPYLARMRENIAAACGVPADCVSVKATTEEGLGFTGRGEGIAAHAVCLIETIVTIVKRSVRGISCYYKGTAGSFRWESDRLIFCPHGARILHCQPLPDESPSASPFIGASPAVPRRRGNCCGQTNDCDRIDHLCHEGAGASGA